MPTCRNRVCMPTRDNLATHKAPVIQAWLARHPRFRLHFTPAGQAKLQAGQGRAGLGRLPGALRYRHPPPPGPGQLRLQLLLGRLVPRSSGTAPACGTATRTQPRREGAARRRPPASAVPPPAPSWPRALRAIHAWLSPWIALQRWWSAWSTAPPPPQLQALINSVAAGCGLHLYIPT